MKNRIFACIFFILHTLFLNAETSNQKTFYLSSLSYFYDLKIEEIDAKLGLKEKETEDVEDETSFEKEDVAALWAGLKDDLNEDLQEAYLAYEESEDHLEKNEYPEARERLFIGLLYLSKAWLESIDEDIEEALTLSLNSLDEVQPLSLKALILERENQLTQEFINRLEKKGSKPESLGGVDSFESNPFLSSDAKNKMRPFLLKKSYPLFNTIEYLFGLGRVTQDASTFKQAGFSILRKQPRSFIIVASHPSLPGILLKLHLDNELRKKKGISGWVWFVKRCEGASKIRKIIKDNQIAYFEVAKKYLYPLPAKFSPPVDPNYERKPVVLVVQDMNIFPSAESANAWKTVFTKQHLNELYTIISLGNGSSYRPDNIPYSRSGKFAFIDTEYPDRKPNFRGVRAYLPASLKKYWDELIKKGGPNKIK